MKASHLNALSGRRQTRCKVPDDRKATLGTVTRVRVFSWLQSIVQRCRSCFASKCALESRGHELALLPCEPVVVLCLALLLLLATLDALADVIELPGPTRTRP